MSDAGNREHSGFIINIKQPTRDGYAACVIVTPKYKDGQADVSEKMERNMKKEKTVAVVEELLATVGASEELLSQIRSL